MNRPCLVCGQVTEESRCPEHRPRTHRSKDTRRRKGKGQGSHDQVWRKLSTKARRDSPFCEDCGAVDDLTCDHLIPKSIAPELVHTVENIAVRCRPCNSRKGTKFADDDARKVLDRLHATYRRHPTRTTRELIATTEQALTRGNTPMGAGTLRRGEAKGAMNTGRGGTG